MTMVYTKKEVEKQLMELRGTYWHDLTEWEREFLRDKECSAVWLMTEKQRSIITKIYMRVHK